MNPPSDSLTASIKALLIADKFFTCWYELKQFGSASQPTQELQRETSVEAKFTYYKEKHYAY